MAPERDSEGDWRQDDGRREKRKAADPRLLAYLAVTVTGLNRSRSPMGSPDAVAIDCRAPV